ncbi:hypothetical protein EUTSA_v10001267mg, partial [Eutrema salsugineum]
VKGVEAAGQEKDSDKWTDAEKKKSKVTYKRMKWRLRSPRKSIAAAHTKTTREILKIQSAAHCLLETLANESETDEDDDAEEVSGFPTPSRGYFVTSVKPASKPLVKDLRQSRLQEATGLREAAGATSLGVCACAEERKQVQTSAPDLVAEEGSPSSDLLLPPRRRFDGENLDPLGKVTSRAEYAQVKLVVMPISSFSISRTVKRKVSPESHCTLFEEGLPFVSKGEAFSNATCLHLSRSLKLGAYGNG